MYIFLILALLIAILAVIFAVQNVAIVTITFFAWNISTSLAVALLVALGVGVLITLLISLPSKFKSGWNNTSQKKKFSNLEMERDTLKQKVEEMRTEQLKDQEKLKSTETEVSNLEEQLASMSATFVDGEESPGIGTAGSLTASDGAIATNSIDVKPDN